MAMSNARLLLSALEFFDAAARHQNFRRAADEIGVTPGAISQRIKSLETYVGHPLFTRTRHGVQLTVDGERFREAADLIFAKLSDTLERIRLKPAKETLSVMVSPYFGSRWLSHRLIHFWQLHPQIELRLRQLQEPFGPDRLETDVLIKYGRDAPPTLACRPLVQARSVAVCSPEVLSSCISAGTSPIASLTLLHFRSRQYWMDWLTAAGFSTERAWLGPIVEDIHLLMEAAASGQGLALGTRPIIDEDLKSGRLVLAHPVEWSGGFAYQFICRQEGLEVPKIKAFYTWISDEARTQETLI